MMRKMDIICPLYCEVYFHHKTFKLIGVIYNPKIGNVP